MTGWIPATLSELHNEIQTAVDGLDGSYVQTGIDNFVYSDRPGSTVYYHFQLGPTMTSEPAAITYLQSQLIKARAMLAERDWERVHPTDRADAFEPFGDEREVP